MHGAGQESVESNHRQAADVCNGLGHKRRRRVLVYAGFGFTLGFGCRLRPEYSSTLHREDHRRLRSKQRFKTVDAGHDPRKKVSELYVDH